MTLEMLGDWEDTWNEQLYKRDYDSLPSFMEDCLFEYFEAGGTAEKFNKRYSYGEDTAQLIKDLYKEFKKS